MYVYTCVYVYMPIPVAARSRARYCGRSLTGVAGSNPAGVTDFSLLLVLCAVHVRRADHSFRGVLRTVVCLNVIVKPL